ncbi:30S ribosomal protein S4 [Deferribacterales bacterium RsTz2092]|nr:30S ribosomal protein S4 [Deferribacterales bacterium]
MARYTGPSCKLCRREGSKLYLKGTRCYTEKCGLDKKAYAPGQHGKNQKKVSDYGVQLREKQKMKRLYGVLEGQFRKYFERATRSAGITGEILIQLLERRLDNVLYRSGFATSRKEARQLVRHDHVLVDGKKVNIPSYSIKSGQVVRIADASKKLQRISDAIEGADGRGVTPEWLLVSKDNFEANVSRLPERSDVGYDMQESLIVELYSK